MGYIGRHKTKEARDERHQDVHRSGIHCVHCAAAIKEEVSSVEGVDAVDVDLDAKVVTIRGAR